MSPESIELTPEEIYEFNLWLLDHPKYQRMSWREQVTMWWLNQ
ncbi:hypothetical protein [Paenibacillus motobuensis]